MFVLLNVWQRRQAHLFTHLNVKRTTLPQLTRLLSSVSAEGLQHLSNLIRDEGYAANLTEDEKELMTFLRTVNTMSANIPGSHAAKLSARNKCNAYFAAFGVGQLFLTITPSPDNSPVFCLMAGDTSINLDSRYPDLLPTPERAKLLAKDPVAAADFYERSIQLIFRELFGWNYTTRQSLRQGGILGPMRSFFGTSEFTNRGCLHGHFIIWLVGGCNPSELHRRLHRNPQYVHQVLTAIGHITKHHLPVVDIPLADHDPRTENPPEPPDLCNLTAEQIDQIIADWEAIFVVEVKRLGEKCQRHVCRPVCHKYGNEGKCRFLFPHATVLNAYYDEASQSIILAVLDPTVNHHSPIILVMCRHNHDLCFILSGKSAKAAMFYITDYITKMDLKTYQILSLMSEAVLRVSSETPSDDPVQRSKHLLHRCLSQFSRCRQIHAQQAVRYLRGHDDTVTSHETVPMLSNALLSVV